MSTERIRRQKRHPSKADKIGIRLFALHPRLPRPEVAAGDRRFAWLLGFLEHVNDVDLLPVGGGDSSRNCRSLRKYFSGEVLADRWHGIEWHALRRQYGFCIIEFWHLAELAAPLLRRTSPWLPIVVDSVDVHFVREEAAAALGLMDRQSVAERRARELEVYNAADAVIVISEEDRLALQNAGVTTATYIVPIIAPSRPRPLRARQKELLFVGGFNHAPNTDGLIWFMHECWEHIRAAVPDTILTVVASNPTPEVLALANVPGVDVVGPVPQPDDYLDRAAVSIAPLRYGGGMKGKVCEALASGVPLVTTAVGVQGLNVKDGEGARVQNTARGFADAVIWALSHCEEAELMGMRGRKIVELVCGCEAASQTLMKLVESLAQTPTPWQATLWGLRAAAIRSVDLLRMLAVALGMRRVKRTLVNRLTSYIRYSPM